MTSTRSGSPGERQLAQVSAEQRVAVRDFIIDNYNGTIATRGSPPSMATSTRSSNPRASGSKFGMPCGCHTKRTPWPNPPPAPTTFTRCDRDGTK